jgi:hypothetical protein
MSVKPELTRIVGLLWDAVFWRNFGDEKGRRSAAL